MKVYLVMYHDYDHTHPHAICSNPEAAQGLIDEMVVFGEVPRNYSITEYDLDEHGTEHMRFFGDRLGLDTDM